MTRFAFSNYRNLARRAQNSKDVEGEIHLLGKCLEVAPHGEAISPNTLADVTARLLDLITTKDGNDEVA